MGVHLYTNGAWTDSGRIYRNSLNRINADDFYLSFKQQDGTYQGTRSTIYLVRMKPFSQDDIGKTFTFSMMLSPNTNNVRVSANIGGQELNGTTNSQGLTKITFLCASVDDYLYFNWGSEGSVVQTLWNLMLNLGNTALTYEPYNVVDWYTNNGHGYSSGAWS